MKKIIVASMILLFSVSCVTASKYSTLEKKYNDLKKTKSNIFKATTFLSHGNISVIDNFTMLPIINTDKAIKNRLGTGLIKKGTLDFQPNEFSYIMPNATSDIQMEPFSESNSIETVEDTNGKLSLSFGIKAIGVSIEGKSKYKNTFSIFQSKGASILANDLNLGSTYRYCSNDVDNRFIITTSTAVNVTHSLYKERTGNNEITSPAFTVDGNLYTKQTHNTHSTYNGVLFVQCKDIIETIDEKTKKRIEKILHKKSIMPIVFSLKDLGITKKIKLKPYIFQKKEIESIKKVYKQ